MDAATRRLVRERAGHRCEYCGLPQHHSPLAALQIEHIMPKKHGGGDEEHNLALACIDCNLCKGSNVAGYDPETDRSLPCFTLASMFGRTIFSDKPRGLSASLPLDGPRCSSWA